MFKYVPRLLLLLVVIALISCDLQTTSTSTTTIPASTAAPTAHLAATSMTYTTVPAPSLPTGIPATTPIASHLTSVSQPSATPIPNIAPEVEWVSKQFDSMWSLRYPKGWQVNEGGIYAGHIDMRGNYEDHQYEIDFSYPLFDQSVDALSLDTWVRQTLERLPEDQRVDVTISDITVAGTAAKKLRNLPDGVVGQVTHQVYIWRTGDRNPRWILIRQIDEQPTDAGQMERLFDQILAGIG